MRIFVEDNYEGMSRRAAQIFAQEIKENPTSAFGFATGSTPVGMYAELARMHREEELDFSRITTFNLDEYCGLDQGDPQSYMYFMQDQLFGKVNLPPASINIPNGKAADIQQECQQYDERIEQAGGVRMQILGIGVNGHIGFNEPDDFFSSGTQLVDLTPSTIDANARFFENPEQVPRQAVSMGIKTIMMSQKILLIANGANKAEILHKMIHGRIHPQVPASVLQLHRDVTVVADSAAAALLEGTR